MNDFSFKTKENTIHRGCDNRRRDPLLKPVSAIAAALRLSARDRPGGLCGAGLHGVTHLPLSIENWKDVIRPPSGDMDYTLFKQVLVGQVNRESAAQYRTFSSESWRAVVTSTTIEGTD